MFNSDHRSSIETPLAPGELLDRLRAEAVSYEAIFDDRAPTTGYVNFVEHALTGPKTVVCRIDGPSFLLMPIGIWPVKGQNPLTNAGALYGTVEATKAGTRVSTRYRLSFGIVAFLCVFAAASAGVVALSIVVTVFHPAMEGLVLLQCLAAASALFTLIMACYYGIGGSQQRRMLEVALHELCDDTCYTTIESTPSDGLKCQTNFKR